MNYNTISKILQVKDEESDIFMPNEIFEDFKTIKDSSHKAYAYSYVYLSHYLYRNCKYFNVKTLIDNNIMKQILGYKKSNVTMNFLTKNGGLLEKMSYLLPTKDYPTMWELDDYDDVKFFMSSELAIKDSSGDVIDNGLSFNIPPKFFLKYPYKAFHRQEEVEYDDGTFEMEDCEGTFNRIDNTHQVNMDLFLYCMEYKSAMRDVKVRSKLKDENGELLKIKGKQQWKTEIVNKEVDESLGVIGFYLYNYLKYKNDKFVEGYDVPMAKLAEDTGLHINTLVKYMDLLKGYNMIDFDINQEYFVYGMDKKERLANTYRVNDVDEFTNKIMPFKKMKFQTHAEYMEIKMKEHEESKDGKDNKLVFDFALPY